MLETDLLSCWPNMTVVPPKGTSICHGNDSRARSMRTALILPGCHVWLCGLSTRTGSSGCMAGKVLEDFIEGHTAP